MAIEVEHPVGPARASPSNGGIKRRKMGEMILLLDSAAGWSTHQQNRLLNGGWNCHQRLSVKGHHLAPFADGRVSKYDNKSYEFLNDQLCPLRSCEESSMPQDDINYSQAWFYHHRRREHLFKPFYPGLCSSTTLWEQHRLQAIANMWRAVKTHHISPITVHLSVWLMNKLLWTHFTRPSPANMTRDVFATCIAVAFRVALKFEERPETLWSIRRIWDVLPVFETWSIDRSEQSLNRIESEALRKLNDRLDLPLCVQFFDKYILVGGWPLEISREYSSLGHFVLALSTFVHGEQHLLQNISPSKLAAAAVVLSVKIVNGDASESYEFYPERFAAFSQLSMRDLQPVIKGLSAMLRKKPFEASVLGKVYPEWGEHEWQ